jgi:hypothetical protein
VDNTGFTINAKVYDFLKWIALTVLPALAALIITLGITLNWSSAPIVAGAVTAVDTFLGIVLNKSSGNFKAQSVLGDLIITQDSSGMATGMKVIGTQENPIFKDGSTVTLNVKREQQVT